MSDFVMSINEEELSKLGENNSQGLSLRQLVQIVCATLIIIVLMSAM